MKIAISTALLIGALASASAQTTTNLYIEDWGSATGTPTTLSSVGWTAVGPPGGYSGMYTQASVDDDTAQVLSNRVIYFGGNAGVGIIFTTNGAGNGGSGDSSFTSINPTQYSNLTLNVEAQGSYHGGSMTNFFAVLVGGAWYVSTNHMTNAFASAGGNFGPCSLPYTTNAANWYNLTVNPVTPAVTIGTVASANLSGTIDGVGIVGSLGAASSWDYNNFTISAAVSNAPIIAPVINAPGYSQTTFVGGGASFTVQANVGTQPFTYIWQKNGVTLSNGATGLGSTISGATTNLLTILNVSTSDQASYSVIVSNLAGFDASTNYLTNTLTVTNAPSDFLYAETFPYIGPLATGIPLSMVGWSGAIPDNPKRVYSLGGGDGAAYSFEDAAGTVALFTSTATDTGFSGLPFPTINPANYPFVSFRCDIAPDYAPAGVTAYFAVQMNGSSWYSSAAPILVPATTASATFATYGQQFDPTAGVWNTLTLNSTSAIVGNPAAANLSGNITGAGVVFVFTAPATFDIDNFLVVTDSTPPSLPTITSLPDAPYPQTVYAGGGASFALSAVGTFPLAYSWQFNNVTLTNGPTGSGSIVSGATTPTLTIVNVSAADQGNYVGFVTNGAGSAESDSGPFGATPLTVVNPPVGLLYSESFPYIGPAASQSLPVSTVGWANAIPDNSDRVYQPSATAGEAAVYAYEGGPATTAFYTTTALDTGLSGLPFPPINLAFYPSLTFSVDIAPDYSPTNVSAYFALQLNSANWFVSSTPLPVATGTATTTFATYTQEFTNSAVAWDTLSIGGTGSVVGAQASSALSGVITGAGVVFVHTGTGGTFDFENFTITGTGIGGINAASVSGNAFDLAWVGNPAVNLQSTTNLASPIQWLDVPNTLGAYGVSVSATGPQEFFRLIQH